MQKSIPLPITSRRGGASGAPLLPSIPAAPAPPPPKLLIAKPHWGSTTSCGEDGGAQRGQRPADWLRWRTGPGAAQGFAGAAQPPSAPLCCLPGPPGEGREGAGVGWGGVSSGTGWEMQRLGLPRPHLAWGRGLSISIPHCAWHGKNIFLHI